MPLKRGKKWVGTNIKRMRREGKPHKQAVAIALRVAGMSRKSRGKRARS
jgi:hypothetical protein